MFLFKYHFYPNTRLIPASEFLDMHCGPFVGEIGKRGQFLADGYFVNHRSEIAYYGPCAEKTSLTKASFCVGTAQLQARTSLLQTTTAI